MERKKENKGRKTCTKRIFQPLPFPGLVLLCGNRSRRKKWEKQQHFVSSFFPFPFPSPALAFWNLRQLIGRAERTSFPGKEEEEEEIWSGLEEEENAERTKRELRLLPPKIWHCWPAKSGWREREARKDSSLLSSSSSSSSAIRKRKKRQKLPGRKKSFEFSKGERDGREEKASPPGYKDAASASDAGAEISPSLPGRKEKKGTASQ